MYLGSKGQQFVIIDATDNNKTRLLIHETVKNSPWKMFSISSGNEEFAGQVIFSRTSTTFPMEILGQSQRLRAHATDVAMPSFFDIFPTTPIDKLPNELSCAEAAVSSPQNIHTNMTAANIIFGYVNKLLSDQPISELAVFFDTQTMAQKIYSFTEKDLEALLSLTKNNQAKMPYLQQKIEDGVTPPTWRKVQEEAAAKRKEEQERLQAMLDEQVQVGS